MTDTTYGRDLYSLEDVDPDRVVSDVELVAQDAYWRLKTPRGAGILSKDAPNYGIDLLDWLGAEMTQAQLAAIPAIVRAELAKDERLLEVTVQASYEGGPNGVLTLTIDGDTAAGPFTLVVAVDELTVELLKLSTGGA